MKWLLLFSDSHLILCSWRCGYRISKRVFANDSQGQQALLACVAGKKIGLLSVLFNVLDEELTSITLPYVGFWERERLYQRAVKKEYADDFLTGFQFQRRDAEGRRDARLLLLSLGQKKPLQKLFQQLSEVGVERFQLHSFPVVCQSLLADMRASARHILLVTHHGDAFRHSFFLDQKICFSRLLRAVNLENRAQQVERELETTQQFLRARQWLGERDSAEVLELPQAEHFAEQMQDPLYLAAQLILVKRREPDYRLEEKKSLRLHWRKVFYAFFFIFLLMPFVALEAWSFMQATERLTEANRVLQKSLPPEQRLAGFSGSQLKQLVQAAKDQVGRSDYSNVALFYDLSALLQDFPAVVVDKLTWGFLADSDALQIRFEGRILAKLGQQNVAEGYRHFLQALKHHPALVVLADSSTQQPLKQGVLAQASVVEQVLPFSLLLSVARDRFD